MLFNSVAVWIYLKIELWLRKMEKTRMWTCLMVICQPLSTDQWNMWKFIPWIAFLHWNYYNFVCSKKKIRNCVWATDPLTSELSSLAPRGVGRGRESVNLTLLWHVLENKTASWCIKAHSLPLVNCVTSPVWKAVLPTAMLLLMTT